MRELIGVSGKPGAGKTTICEYLARKYEFNHYEMSGPIVEDVRRWMEGFGVDLSRYDKEQYRLILQGWGHFARVAKGEDYWIGRVLSNVVLPAVIGGISIFVKSKQFRIKEVGC